MSDPLYTGLALLAVVALVAANGFFVATEFAFVGVRRSRIEQLAREGNVRARLLLRALDNLDNYIAATQLGVTMSSLALGWIGEPALGSVVDPALERVLDPIAAEAVTHTLAVALSFALVTAVLIVFGELAPKQFTLQAAEATALWVVIPILVFNRIFRPFIWLLNTLGRLVVRPLGIRAPSREAEIGPEELEIIIQASARAGLLSESELLLARRALEFGEVRAYQVMIPRTEVVAIDVTASLDEVLETIERHQHTRYPVYEGDLDHVVGILDAKRLLPLVARGETNWLALVRPAVAVPETVTVDVAVEEMRRNRTQFLVLFDEHGGTTGILTADEVLYRLLGRLGGGPVGSEHIRRLSSGNYLLNGLALIADVEDALGVELSDEDYDTIGGLIMGRLGRVPRVGDRVVIDGYEFRVTAMDGRRVDRVLVTRTGAVTADGSRAR